MAWQPPPANFLLPSRAAQLAEATKHYSEIRGIKSALESSIFDTAEELRATNTTLSLALRVQLPRAREALRRVRDETAAARRAATHAKADLRVRAAAYRAVLRRLGRAPDLAIGDTALDAHTAAALVAGEEARRQADEGGFQPADDVQELLAERLLDDAAVAARVQQRKLATTRHHAGAVGGAHKA